MNVKCECQYEDHFTKSKTTKICFNTTFNITNKPYNFQTFLRHYMANQKLPECDTKRLRHEIISIFFN